MAYKNDINQNEWKVWYEDLARKVDNISQRLSTTEILSNGLRDDEGIWRDLRLAQDASTKLVADVDLLKQDVTQLREKNVALHRNMTSLQRDLTATQVEHFTLREDLDTLETENVKLRASMASLQKDNGRLRQQVTSLELDLEEVRCDVTGVKNDVSQSVASAAGRREFRNESRRSSAPAVSTDNPNLRSYVESLQRKSTDLSAEVSQLRKDMDKLRQEVTSLRGKNGDILADVSTFRSEAETCIHSFKSQITNLEMFMAKSNALVAFHVSLGSPVTTQSRTQTLVCDNVISNVGGGYNARTGVFTAPVAGLYCFLVNASPCHRSEDKRARLSVVLDHRKIAHVYSRGLWWSTGHTAVQLDVGHKVWLRTFDDGDYTFSEGWTNFTGMLLQAQL